MRLINLSKCYFYTSFKTKVDGEVKNEWKYKISYLLNKQQDINELDKKSSGVIDYERVKLRTTKDVDIQKGDGVSFNELEEPIYPPYVVISHTIVGNSHLIICESFQK